MFFIKNVIILDQAFNSNLNKRKKVASDYGSRIDL